MITEEIRENIFRISVVLPNNPLKELNSYFIRGTDRDLLIDTGFRCRECHSALEAGLKELNSDPRKRDVLVTHLHSDHSGMADLFAGPDRTVYMTEIDLNYENRYLHSDLDARRMARYIKEGFSIQQLNYISDTNPARTMALPALPLNTSGLQDGDILTVGNYQLQTILTPGHTPGNAMFWIKEYGILFSGDHILFDITPNITAWEDVEDSLGDYLASLEKVKSLPVCLTLPGHRKTGNYQERVRELEQHHQMRLREILHILLQHSDLNAYEIAGKMTWQIRAKNWDEFPLVQKWFAVGECLAHLDYLRKRKKIMRRFVDGVWRYTLVQQDR